MKKLLFLLFILLPINAFAQSYPSWIQYYSSSGGGAGSGSFADNVFTITDNADPTKAFQFEASTIATGTTRTITVPNANFTLVGLEFNNVFGTTQTIPTLSLGGVFPAAGTAQYGGSTIIIENTAADAFEHTFTFDDTGGPSDQTTTWTIDNNTSGGSEVLLTNSPGVLAFRDNNHSICDQGDLSKCVQFDVVAVSTFTTRTWSIPNTSDTFAGLGSNQTWTGANTFNGTVNKRLAMEAVTGSKSPTTSEADELCADGGDADGSTITLPAAAGGLCYHFIVQTAQTQTITAAAGDTIRVAASVTAGGGSITGNVVGDAITLCSINTTEWIATAQIGTSFP